MSSSPGFLASSATATTSSSSESGTARWTCDEFSSSPPPSKFFSDVSLVTRAPQARQSKHKPPPLPTLSYSSDYEEYHEDSLASLSSLLASSASSTDEESVFGPAAAAGLTTQALPPGFLDLEDLHEGHHPKKKGKKKGKKGKKGDSDQALEFLRSISTEFFSTQWAVAAAEKTVLALRTFARTGGVRLDLSFVGLGQIPLELITLLANVDSFSKCILHGNELRAIPAAVQELTQLTQLDLSRNLLSELHPGIGRLTNLEVLDLRWNKLETLPPQIGRLTKLQRLLLASNTIVHLPTATSRLTNLKVLDVYHNHVAKITAVAPLKSLTHLDVSRNDLVLPSKAVCQLTSLTSLSLHSNGLRKMSKSLGALSSLTSLVLYGNKLTHLPDSLGDLTALRLLNVRENRLVALPSTLGSCASLTELNVRGNALVSLPESITRCANLQVLNAGDNDLYLLPEDLGACSDLETIHVPSNNLIALPRSLQDLPHLTHLDAARNPLRSLPSNTLAYVSFHDLSPYRLARTLAFPLWLMGSHSLGLGSPLWSHLVASFLPLALIGAILGLGHQAFAGGPDPASESVVWAFSGLLAFTVVLLMASVVGHIVVSVSRSASVPPPFQVRTSSANVLSVVLNVLVVGQAMALAIHPDLGWPGSLSQITRIALLRFEGLFSHAPYVSWVLALAWGLSLRFLVEIGLFIRRGAYADHVIGVLLFADTALALPTTRNLALTLSCSYWDDRAPTLATDAGITCWEGNHLIMAGCALLTLVLYVPTSILTSAPWVARSVGYLDIRRTEIATYFVRSILAVLGLASAFFQPGKHTSVYLLVLGLAGLALAGAAGYLRPYGASLWRANIVEAAGACSVVLTSALTIWVKVDDISSPWTVFTALVVGVGLIGLAAAAAMVAFDAMDTFEDSDEISVSFGDDGGFRSHPGGSSYSDLEPMTHMLPQTEALLAQLRHSGLDSNFDYDEYAAGADEYGYEFDAARVVFKHEVVDEEDQLFAARNPMYTTLAWAEKRG